MELLTVQEAAALLRITPASLYAWAEEEPARVPVIRISRRAIRFERAALERWLAERSEGGEAS